MLHLAIDSKEFTYLNYLAVMSAQRFNDVTFWYRQQPENNKYWDIVKKQKRIEFKEIDQDTGITIDQYDQTGRLDMIYLAEVEPRLVDDAMIDHKDMYNKDGEFEIKDMIAVRVFDPDKLTLESVRNKEHSLAELVRAVLLERVWNVEI